VELIGMHWIVTEMMDVEDTSMDAEQDGADQP
jgi:hypothetical protein